MEHKFWLGMSGPYTFDDTYLAEDYTHILDQGPTSGPAPLQVDCAANGVPTWWPTGPGHFVHVAYVQSLVSSSIAALSDYWMKVEHVKARYTALVGGVVTAYHTAVAPADLLQRLCKPVATNPSTGYIDSSLINWPDVEGGVGYFYQLLDVTDYTQITNYNGYLLQIVETETEPHLVYTDPADIINAKTITATAPLQFLVGAAVYSSRASTILNADCTIEIGPSITDGYVIKTVNGQTVWAPEDTVPAPTGYPLTLEPSNILEKTVSTGAELLSATTMRMIPGAVTGTVLTTTIADGAATLSWETPTTLAHTHHLTDLLDGTTGQTLRRGASYWEATSVLSSLDSAVYVTSPVAGNIFNVDRVNSISYFRALYSTATLGSNLIVNGTFTSDLSSWTVGDAGWSYSGGKALHSTGYAGTLYQAINLTQNTWYQIDFTLSGVTAGSLAVTFDTLDLSEGAGGFSTSDTYHRAIKYSSASGSKNLTFTPSSTFVGYLDTVSVSPISQTLLPTVSLQDSTGTAYGEARGSYTASNLCLGSGGQYLTIGVRNVVVGLLAGYNLNSASQNTALGVAALGGNTSGSNNTAIGYYACYTGRTVGYNTAVGCLALYSATCASGNTAVGVESGYYLTTGSYNVLLGYLSGRALTASIHNVILGTAAGYSLTGSTTSGNTMVGGYAGAGSTSSIESTILGYYAGFRVITGGYNTFLGARSGYGGSSNTTGSYNVGVGIVSLYSLTSGVSNTVIGPYAGRDLTTGSYNVLLGNYAGYTLTTGSYNIIIGDHSIPADITGSYQLNIGGTIKGNLSTNAVEIVGALTADTTAQVKGLLTLSNGTNGSGIYIDNLASAPSASTTHLLTAYSNNLYWNGVQLATGTGVTTFLALTDTPSSYSKWALTLVNEATNALEWLTSSTADNTKVLTMVSGKPTWATAATSSTTFIALTDTDPTGYTDKGGYIVRVNSTPNGLTFVAPASLTTANSSSMLTVSGAYATLAAATIEIAAGDNATVIGTVDGTPNWYTLEALGYKTSFALLDLTDGPDLDTYEMQQGKTLRVNEDYTGWEFVAGSPLTTATPTLISITGSPGTALLQNADIALAPYGTSASKILGSINSVVDYYSSTSFVLANKMVVGGHTANYVTITPATVSTPYTLTFSSVNLSTDAVGTAAVGQGGTGKNAWTANSIPYLASTVTFGELLNTSTTEIKAITQISGSSTAPTWSPILTSVSDDNIVNATVTASTGAVALSHAAFGEAGTYGGTTKVPQIQTNSTGHVTAVTEVAIAFPAIPTITLTNDATGSLSDTYTIPVTLIDTRVTSKVLTGLPESCTHLSAEDTILEAFAALDGAIGGGGHAAASVNDTGIANGLTINTDTQVLSFTPVAPIVYANLVYAGPVSGTAAAASFRALFNDDLPTVFGLNVGTYGSSTFVPRITVNSKGLVTSANNIAIALHNSVSLTGKTYITLNAGTQVLTVNQVDLTNALDVKGTLPVVCGGTGWISLNEHALLVGNGTVRVNQITASSTVGRALVSAGSSADPEYGALALGTAGNISGKLPLANGGTNADLSAATYYGVVYKASTALANTVQGKEGQFLQSHGNTAPPDWQTVTPQFTGTAIEVWTGAVQAQFAPDLYEVEIGEDSATFMAMTDFTPVDISPNPANARLLASTTETVATIMIECPCQGKNTVLASVTVYIYSSSSVAEGIYNLALHTTDGLSYTAVTPTALTIDYTLSNFTPTGTDRIYTKVLTPATAITFSSTIRGTLLTMRWRYGNTPGGVYPSFRGALWKFTTVAYGNS